MRLYRSQLTFWILVSSCVKWGLCTRHRLRALLDLEAEILTWQRKRAACCPLLLVFSLFSFRQLRSTAWLRGSLEDLEVCFPLCGSLLILLTVTSCQSAKLPRKTDQRKSDHQSPGLPEGSSLVLVRTEHFTYAYSLWVVEEWGEPVNGGLPTDGPRSSWEPGTPPGAAGEEFDTGEKSCSLNN